MVALKKFGINIHRMVFYPFMGAKVSYYVDSRLEMLNAAIVSLAGPASAFIGASSFLAASLFDTQLGLSPDTSVTCARLAEFGFFMNAINLTPISFLDGGQVFSHFPSYYKLAPAIASGFLYHFDYFTAFFHYPLVAYCVYSIVKANWHSLEHNCSAFGWFQFDGEHMKVLALYFILVSSLTVAWVYAANVHDEKQKLLSPKRTKRFKISYKGHEISWDRN